MLLPGLSSTCSEQGLLPSWGAQTSHCSSSSSYRIQTLGTWAPARGLDSFSSRTPEHRLSSCGTQPWFLQGTWDLPASGVKPVSPALVLLDSFPLSHQGNPGNGYFSIPICLFQLQVSLGIPWLVAASLQCLPLFPMNSPSMCLYLLFCLL